MTAVGGIISYWAFYAQTTLISQGQSVVSVDSHFGNAKSVATHREITWLMLPVTGRADAQSAVSDPEHRVLSCPGGLIPLQEEVAK